MKERETIRSKVGRFLLGLCMMLFLLPMASVTARAEDSFTVKLDFLNTTSEGSGSLIVDGVTYSSDSEFTVTGRTFDVEFIPDSGSYFVGYICSHAGGEIPKSVVKVKKSLTIEDEASSGAELTMKVRFSTIPTATTSDSVTGGVDYEGSSTITITLADSATTQTIKVGDTVTDWISGLPDDFTYTAKISDDFTAGGTTIPITITGTSASETTGTASVTIPADYISTGKPNRATFDYSFTKWKVGLQTVPSDGTVSVEDEDLTSTFSNQSVSVTGDSFDVVFEPDTGYYLYSYSSSQIVVEGTNQGTQVYNTETGTLSKTLKINTTLTSYKVYMSAIFKPIPTATVSGSLTGTVGANGSSNLTITLNNAKLKTAISENENLSSWFSGLSGLLEDDYTVTATQAANRGATTIYVTISGTPKSATDTTKKINVTIPGDSLLPESANVASSLTTPDATGTLSYSFDPATYTVKITNLTDAGKVTLTGDDVSAELSAIGATENITVSESTGKKITVTVEPGDGYYLYMVRIYNPDTDKTVVSTETNLKATETQKLDVTVTSNINITVVGFPIPTVSLDKTLTGTVGSDVNSDLTITLKNATLNNSAVIDEGTDLSAWFPELSNILDDVKVTAASEISKYASEITVHISGTPKEKTDGTQTLTFTIPSDSLCLKGPAYSNFGTPDATGTLSYSFDPATYTIRLNNLTGTGTVTLKGDDTIVLSEMGAEKDITVSEISGKKLTVEIAPGEDYYLFGYHIYNKDDSSDVLGGDAKLYTTEAQTLDITVKSNVNINVLVAHIPTVTIGDNLSEIVGSTVSEERTITLANASLKSAISEGANLTSWFSDLPSGFTVTAKSTVDAGAKEIPVTISGTASTETSGTVTLTVPADSLSIPIAATTTFKYSFAKAIYTITLKNPQLTDGDKINGTIKIGDASLSAIGESTSFESGIGSTFDVIAVPDDGYYFVGYACTGVTPYSETYTATVSTTCTLTIGQSTKESTSLSLAAVFSPVPTAAVSDNVTGTVDSAVSTGLTITLTDGKVRTAITAGEDLTSWFTGLPSGFTVTATSDVAVDATEIPVTVSGTPTSASDGTVTVVIPGDRLAPASATGTSISTPDVSTTFTYSFTNVVKGTVQTGDGAQSDLPATVTFTNTETGETYTTTTDENGNYETSLPEGTYDVTVSGQNNLVSGSTDSLTVGDTNVTVDKITVTNTELGDKLAETKTTTKAEIDTAATEAKTAIEALEDLTDEEETAKEAEIDTAVTTAKAAVDAAMNTTDILQAVSVFKSTIAATQENAEETAANNSIDTAASNAKAAIDALSNLSDEEKTAKKAEIDTAAAAAKAAVSAAEDKTGIDNALSTFNTSVASTKAAAEKLNSEAADDDDSDDTSTETSSTTATTTATTSDGSPKTGDSANATGWLILFLAACAGIVGVVLFKKRSNR